eukprot:6250732-Prymnesium_polylepis.1
MAQLKELWLMQNQIGDKGMTAFSTALVSGAMANLKTLYTGVNPGNTSAVKEACGARGISM